MLVTYSGDRAAAAKLLHQLQAQSTRANVEPYYLAVAYASAGDKDAAFLC
jgi:hypothetical protein